MTGRSAKEKLEERILVESAASPDDPMSPMSASLEQEAIPDDEGAIKAGRLAGKTMSQAIWILALPVLLQQTMAAGVGFVDKLLAGNLPGEIARPAMDGVGIGSFIGWFIGIALTGHGLGRPSREPSGARAVDEPLARLGRARRDPHDRACRTARALLEPFPRGDRGLRHLRADAGTGDPLLRRHDGRRHVPPRRGRQIAVWVNVVNILVSWLISGVVIRAFGASIPNPSPLDPAEWGVFGIAAGSAISYVVGAWMTWRVLRKGVKDLHLETSEMRLDRAMSWRIIKVGVPNFFEGLAMWTVNLFVLGFIGRAAELGMGTATKDGLVGAHIITVQWEAFSFLPGFAMGTAAGALAGQYLGAGSSSMARRAIWRCTLIGMGIMGTMGLCFMLFGHALTRIISDDPVHLELVPKCLFASGCIQVFFALAMVVRNGLRGVGDTKWILGITVFGCYAIRLPLAWYLGIHLEFGLVGIWWGLMLELAVRGLMFLARFKYGAWNKVQV